MASDEDLTGALLEERYRLERLLGSGGMGQVYEGTDETLDRKVAIKVLLRKHAGDEVFQQRFLREAKAASKIQHPNVVQIIDFGRTSTGSVFYVMEFLRGRDLKMLLREQGVLPWSRARNILLQITKALAATHDRDIVHRDIKPANFFLVQAHGLADFVKLIDFGIAKSAASQASDDALELSLTGVGEVMGTAKYMSPEQAYGAPNDPRMDVYAVGIVAYEMLSGTVPFTGESVFEILKKQVDDPPVPLREHDPTLSPAVEAVVMRALAKKAGARFGSMEEFGATLAAIPPHANATSGPHPALTAGAPRAAILDQWASNEIAESSWVGIPLAPDPAVAGIEPAASDRARRRSHSASSRTTKALPTPKLETKRPSEPTLVVSRRSPPQQGPRPDPAALDGDASGPHEADDGGDPDGSRAYAFAGEERCSTTGNQTATRVERSTDSKPDQAITESSAQSTLVPRRATPATGPWPPLALGLVAFLSAAGLAGAAIMALTTDCKTNARPRATPADLRPPPR